MHLDPVILSRILPRLHHRPGGVARHARGGADRDRRGDLPARVQLLAQGLRRDDPRHSRDGRPILRRRLEWLAPLPILSGIGLVLGYALLGAGWLVLKSQGALRDWAYRRIPWLAAGVLAVVAAAFVAALIQHNRIHAPLAERAWGLIFPVAGLLAMGGVFVGVPRRPSLARSKFLRKRRAGGAIRPREWVAVHGSDLIQVSLFGDRHAVSSI